MQLNIRIGTAGWSIPTHHAPAFAGQGSHIERYARRMTAVEINSSFYRPHRSATYARWAMSVPGDFHFAVKMPREITHDRRLLEVEAPLDRFLSEIVSLGAKLGPVLVQLPPSFQHDFGLLDRFWTTLRSRHDGAVACEPRHVSWFTDGVDEQLASFRVARVAADPAPAPRAAETGGWTGLAYWRLHGSPKTYHSAYTQQFLSGIANGILHQSPDAECWCILDNTARGEATANALQLQDMIWPEPSAGPRPARIPWLTPR